MKKILGGKIGSRKAKMAEMTVYHTNFERNTSHLPQVRGFANK